MREVVLDTETTGLDPEQGHRIIEIGCIEMINRRKTGRVFHSYVNPQRDVPSGAFAVHGISTEFLLDKPLFKHVAEEFFTFIEDSTLVIHNAQFDIRFINAEFRKIKFPMLNQHKVIDTLALARKTFPGSPASLDALCKKFNIDLSSRDKHGALLDAELLSLVYVELTGGSQGSLVFQPRASNNVEKKISANLRRAERHYQASEYELDAHKKFLEKINNPIWQE